MTPLAVELLADDHGWGHMGGWGGGWMWFWGVAMMVLIVVLVVWLVRSIAGSSRPDRPDPSDRARSILSERYARGELSTEEYRERLSELQ
jgi:putative membrane protein